MVLKGSVVFITFVLLVLVGSLVLHPQMQSANAILPDIDADGIPNEIDNCKFDYNPLQEDADEDGFGDVCQNADPDGDGIQNRFDNCRFKPNSSQEDTDSDRVGDACEDINNNNNLDDDDNDSDTLPNYKDTDDDNDGIPTSSEDDGDMDFNNDDTDDDGIPDWLDATFTPPQSDVDHDGIDDVEDNCPLNYNPLQEDADEDGFGDDCDLFPLDPLNDGEGDGFGANEDNCPLIFNSGQEDADGDGIGDACEERPTVSIDDVLIVDSLLVEGDSGTTIFNFRVWLSHPAPFPLSVQFFTADGNALAGEDYVPNSGTVNFATGEITKQVVMQVIGDKLAEQDEYFTVFLFDAAGADIADAKGVGLILNDDNSPVADGQSIPATEDVSVAITLTATDADLDTLTFAVNTLPTHGDLSGTAPNLTYTPHLNFNGDDFFTFKANDGVNESNEARISIVIAPINDAPVAADDTASTQEDVPIEISALNLVSNDLDVDGDVLSLTGVLNPTGGTVDFDTLAGIITFIPSHDFNGAASFEYVITDGLASDTGLVSVAVAPINDAPTLETQPAITTLEDVVFTGTMTAFDVDGDTLTVTVLTQGTKGTVLILDNSAYTYAPNANINGADQFTLRISDGNSFFDVSITVDITSVNDSPTVNAGADQSVVENTSVTLAGSGSDVEGDTLTFLWTQTTGAPIILSDTSAPNPTFIAPLVGPSGETLTFTLTISDGNGGTATDTVVIHVNNIESVPPEAYNQFDPTTKDVLVYGTDDRDGNLGPIPPASVVSSRWNDDDKDHGSYAELRTYIITDAAENKLTLKELVKMKGKEIKVKVISIQYNDDSVIIPTKNSKSFEWSIDKKGSIKELEQTMKVGKEKSEQKVKAKFDSKKNQTKIESEKPKLKKILPGLVLLKMSTANGKLVISY